MSGDRWIRVVECEIKDPTCISMAERVMAGFRVAKDKMSLFTTTADWMTDPNCWAIHNDASFAASRIKARASDRIADAATEVRKRIIAEREKPGNEHLPLALLFEKPLYIKISDADFQQEVKRVLEAPAPHPNYIQIPPGIVRAILPIYDAIEGAVSEDPDKPKDEPKPEATEAGEAEKPA
jgi:hypothetical protein